MALQGSMDLRPGDLEIMAMMSKYDTSKTRTVSALFTISFQDQQRVWIHLAGALLLEHPVRKQIKVTPTQMVVAAGAQYVDHLYVQNPTLFQLFSLKSVLFGIFFL